MKYIGEDRPNSFTNGSVYNISKHSAGYVKTKDDSGSIHSLDIYFVLQNFIHPSHYKPEGESKKQKVCLYQVGDTVYHWRYGKGEVLVSERNVRVDFEKGINRCFTADGRYDTEEPSPTLSFTPYDLANGGFSQERPKPEPKIGDVGYFWNDDSSLCGYSKIEHIVWGATYKYEPKFGDCCKNFSHEPPAHIK